MSTIVCALKSAQRVHARKYIDSFVVFPVTLTPEVDSSTVTSTCGGNGTKLQLIGRHSGGGVPGSGQQIGDAADQTKTSAADVTASSVATSYGVLSPKMTSSTSPSPSGQLPSLRPQQVQVLRDALLLPYF